MRVTKTTALILSALLAVSLTGCNSEKSEDTDISAPIGESSSSASDASSENGTNSADNSESSGSDTKPQKPGGEPTFLTYPDGTPVYTSEISEICAGSEFDGNYETLTLEQAERRAKECEGQFNVDCAGYAYGFIPEKALNRVDDPEMFQDIGGGENYEFLGEEDELSNDCTRIKVGDKFGTLTVKSAQTFFSDKWLLKEFSKEPGAYYNGGEVTFDGEVELTGFVNVWKDSDYQGAGGTMVFYPDGDSSVKIPVILESGLAHQMRTFSSGCFGDWYCDLGNMSDVKCDVSALHKGDVFKKVKITAKNVSSGHGGVRLELEHIEVL